jgi:hypothetical protein
LSMHLSSMAVIPAMLSLHWLTLVSGPSNTTGEVERVQVLILENREYIMRHGKEELKLQMELVDNQVASR